jgi:hypothetical protein
LNRQDDDLYSLLLGADRFRGRNSIHVRHIDVHQDDIRVHILGGLDRLLAGARNANHLDIRLELQ